jgi:HAD superfamily hydrolase (TIGR01490 family)
LAIFDLDNTLLAGDSDYLWGQFLVEAGIVDAEYYERENQRFYRAYLDGSLDMEEYLTFALAPLACYDPMDLFAWRERFLEANIRPILQAKALALLDWHRKAGDILLIITATNRFVTQPIAEMLRVPNLLATEVEQENGRFTGRSHGTPCFRDGKIRRLRAWLDEAEHSLEGSWFYSDSHNDLPLLGQVTYPVAVDPDDILYHHARERGWRIISLRD